MPGAGDRNRNVTVFASPLPPAKIPFKLAMSANEIWEHKKLDKICSWLMIQNTNKKIIDKGKAISFMLGWV